MTQIRAFKAIYYNQQKVADLSEVVCPPYDVISKEEQMRLHASHPHNFIHILLGLDKSNDNRYDNKYTRAKKLFDDWYKKGILQEDAKACIYFYRQEYMVRGVRHSRVGFIALMRLQDKENSTIYPHENTHARAKEDRLRLWRNVKANTSPIFVCFSDREKRIETIAREVAGQQPFIDITDAEGVRHVLWRLEDAGLITKVKDTIANQNVFIADGHHRYEVALEYRKMMLAKKQRITGREPCNFIMTYFTNIDSKDLLILPIHRVIKKLRKPFNFLDDFFRIDKASSKQDLAILLAKAGQNEHAFGMYTREGISLLRLKNRLLIDQHITEGSKDFRSLDATILQSFILNRIGNATDDIIYSKDIDEATGMVDARQADACFIMNPVKIEQLKAIALSGERMPPKTTFFYPKVLSGLTVSRLNIQ